MGLNEYFWPKFPFDSDEFRTIRINNGTEINISVSQKLGRRIRMYNVKNNAE